MSYEPLHQKYRPQTFANLVGQSAIADTLSNAISRQRIAPAYLFSGPRGTGKTSSARILAKSLNCINSDQPTPQPCGQCKICRAIKNNTALDIIEIDAASNTGVDNIREIIERSSFAPVQCRYKLYVIDEAHMLSTAAFNALLKTLEEPPPRVVFVLATTDPQRVLPTIISRCQRFDFQRIPLAAMIAHLRYIAQKEEINITEEALTVIAQVSHGGLRDAQSLLDQLSLLSGQISLDRVWDLVGAIPEQDLISIIQAIKHQNGKEIITLCRQLMDRGREPIIVLQTLAGFYRDLLIAKTAPDQSELVALTTSTWKQLCEIAQEWDIQEILSGQRHLQQSESQVKNTTQPRLWLEISLLQLYRTPQPISTQQEVKTVSSSPSPQKPPEQKAVTPSTPPPKEETQKSVPVAAVPSEDHPEDISKPETSSESIETKTQEQIWGEVIANLPLPSQSLVRDHCRLLSIEGTVAHIGVKTTPLLSFAQKRQTDIENALKTVLHQDIKVKLQVTGENSGNPSVKEISHSPPASPAPKKKNNLPENGRQKETHSVVSFPHTEKTEKKQEQITEEKSSTQEDIPSTVTEEENLEQVAKQFAKLFNGEVVKFEEEESSLKPNVISTEETNIQNELEEDDH